MKIATYAFSSIMFLASFFAFLKAANIAIALGKASKTSN